MIPRRGFFGKLAAVLGLSTLPVQASEESTERKLIREKMAEKGLGPDDVRTSLMWDQDPDNPGSLQLRFYIDCHGETYGISHYLISGRIPGDRHCVFTAAGVDVIFDVDRSR